jgi:8-oxo-dGTP diphosphatase
MGTGESQSGLCSVLLVRRAQPPLMGEWSLPGGVLEFGERLRDGLVREIREETGLMVEPLALVDALDHIVVGDGTDTVDADAKHVTNDAYTCVCASIMC